MTFPITDQAKADFIKNVGNEMFARMNVWQTFPSTQAKQSLLELVEHFHDLAYGEVAAKAHICPLACGVGKTTAMKFSLKQLISDGYTGGVVLSFYKIVEAESAYNDFVETFGEDRVALITKDHRDNDWQDKDILIITQQRFCSKLTSEKSSAQRKYADIDFFWFKGQPRKIRVWDERLVPAVSYTLTTKDLLNVAGACRDDEHSEQIIVFRDAVKRRLAEASGAVSITVPDFGITSDDLYTYLEEDVRDTFLGVQGETASANKAKGKGKERGLNVREVLMTYKVELPSDAGIFPMLVLDASFRVNRVAYEEMAKAPLPIELEKLVGASFKKSYSKLNINWWRIASGKDKWDTRAHQGVAKRDELMAGIRKAVCASPAKQQTLIICGKAEEVIIRKHLGKLGCEVPPPAFLTWGRHSATNEFKDIGNVVVAHLFNKPDYTYESLMRAYRGLAPDEEIDNQEKRDFIQGDLRDSLYQATLRGTSRQLIEDTCKPMTLWLFASDKPINPRTLCQEIFPEAVFKRVELSEEKKETVSDKILGFVEDFAAVHSVEDILVDDAVLEMVGITKQQFRKARQTAALPQDIAGLGCGFETRGAGRGQKVYLVRALSRV